MSSYTFDAFFYRILTGVLYLSIGMVGALWRIQAEDAVQGQKLDVSRQRSCGCATPSSSCAQGAEVRGLNLGSRPWSLIRFRSAGPDATGGGDASRRETPCCDQRDGSFGVLGELVISPAERVADRGRQLNCKLHVLLDRVLVRLRHGGQSSPASSASRARARSARGRRAAISPRPLACSSKKMSKAFRRSRRSVAYPAKVVRCIFD